MAYLFKLSSRLIVERHLPTIASDAYGIGFVEETCTIRDQYCGCIATVSDRNCFTRILSNSLGSYFCVFPPLDCCLCSPGLYIKGQDWFGFLLLISFTSLFTPHRTLVNTHKINKCAKFGSILLGSSSKFSTISFIFVNEINIIINCTSWIYDHSCRNAFRLNSCA